MKLVAQLVSLFALAAGSGSLDDGSPSLLQVRAAHAASPEQHVLYNSSDKTQPKSGHPFGCTGRTTAENVIQCGLWGDVHQHQKFQGGTAPDSFGTGWYWIAKSRDGAFQAQAFYRQYNGGWTAMSHYAFRFGDTTLFMDRENDGSSWMWKYYWNGQERSFQDSPVNIDGVHWINRARGELANNAAQGQNAHGILTNYDAQRHSCFEFQNVAVWTGYQNWQNVNLGPFGQPGIMEIEGSIDYLDPDFGQCATNQLRVDPSEMLVTIAQNNKVCNDDGLDAHQCEDPDPPPPPSTAQVLCEAHGVAFQHAQDLCAGQDSHGADIYEGCLYDVCASIDADAEQNAVGGAELEAATANPRATCMVTPEPCASCNICQDATRADLSNVVVNNLGGVGPDPSGAEEIRYKNAIDLGSGRLVDVVLVATGAYQTVPNRRGIIPNGHNGQGFGRFTLETGTSSDFTFLFQDATTGAPVSIPDIALTFYDLDEARNRLQRETITVCGVEEVYVTEDTELLYTRSGTCHSLQSSVVGTGADNPRTASELTKTQAARSVTYEFHSRASINWRAEVSGNRWSPRPILFSFEPQVACGASDSETQCNSYSTVHGGHCAGGWLGGNSNQADVAACSSHCRSVAGCRYFAFCQGPDGCDGGSNCAVYNEAAGCPDDDNWGGYEAYINNGPVGGA